MVGPVVCWPCAGMLRPAVLLLCCRLVDGRSVPQLCVAQGWGGGSSGVDPPAGAALQCQPMLWDELACTSFTGQCACAVGADTIRAVGADTMKHDAASQFCAVLVPSQVCAAGTCGCGVEVKSVCTVVLLR